jgi:hypothetical protein
LTGDFSLQTFCITHTSAPQLDPVVIYGIFDEVSDFLRRRAPKNPPSRGFFCPFSDVLLFLWISSGRSSAGDSRGGFQGARCRSADQDTLR